MGQWRLGPCQLIRSWALFTALNALRGEGGWSRTRTSAESKAYVLTKPLTCETELHTRPTPRWLNEEPSLKPEMPFVKQLGPTGLIVAKVVEKVRGKF